MTAEQRQSLCDELETLIDQHDVTTLLDCMSQVCWEKAEHLRSNWGEHSTAKLWEKAAVHLDNTASHTFIKAIS